MEIIQSQELTPFQFQQVNQLWNDEFPISLKDRFGILLNGAENIHHYLIVGDDKNIDAWAVDFEKDGEVRFSILVHPQQQGRGLGTMLINRLKNDLADFYGWVIDHNNDKKENGENYKSPLSFYVKHGFEILHDLRIDNDMLKAVKIRRRS